MNIKELEIYIGYSSPENKLLIVDNFQDPKLVEYLKDRFIKARRNGNAYFFANNAVIYVYGELKEVLLAGIKNSIKYLFAEIELSNLLKYKTLIVNNHDLKYSLTIKSLI